MFQKLVAVLVIVMLAAFGISCRKKPAQTPQPETPSQTAQPAPSMTQAPKPVDFNEAAKKEITSENMQTELEKLEKDIQREGGGAM